MRVPVHIKYVVGIDEAGRGPLAGPVSVGLVLVDRDNLDILSNFHDSKTLKEDKREELYKNLFKFKKEKLLEYSYSLVSERVIDKKGINYAISLGIRRAINRFDLNPNETLVLLDGLLKAPSRFFNQKTITKGDRDIRIIGAASIVAKVKRDRKMRKFASLYPQYGFEKHKGYGTKYHLDCLKKHGMSEIHRRTYYP